MPFDNKYGPGKAGNFDMCTSEIRNGLSRSAAIKVVRGEQKSLAPFDAADAFLSTLCSALRPLLHPGVSRVMFSMER
ncbi:hypothetical protein CBM2589_B10063 [Cupriavidus taiwanensis]|uniref:Uncharacterized protein n=1 Tax=Cupriavidus taiwanensis TaxID=164546 RepID=A0A375B7Y5_9BURK|nr:hypothetical protein CBM2589_B10063 [Cupriavidus taiwanensis]